MRSIRRLRRYRKSCFRRAADLGEVHPAVAEPGAAAPSGWPGYLPGLEAKESRILVPKTSLTEYVTITA
jgi:hypothetical protein